MNTDDIIYKYRSWNDEKHRRALEENQFYFSSPADINDPFDCRVSPDLLLLDTQQKKTQFIEDMISDAKRILNDRKINHTELAKKLLHRLEVDINKMQEEYDEIHSRYTNDRFGVISFSFRWNSILLWSHYANNHTGFCVGLDRKAIEDSDFFDSAGPMHYQDEYPKVDPLNFISVESALSKTHTKAKDWKYEREYRLLKLWVDSTPTVEDRKVKIPDGYFSEVILGKNISLEDQEQILKVSSPKKIPVYKIKVKPRTFILERIKL